MTPPLALVVDDEPLNRQFVATVLVAAGWRVAEAASGEDALARTGPAPALVLMDLCMPGLGGIETVARLRARGGAWGTVPVVAFTTTRLADPAPLLARGFDDYCAKPCPPDELVAAAARWRPGEAATIARLEDRFGTAELRPVVIGFRALLAEALDRLASDGAATMAHRVAGLAGTLGFAALGRRWLALSEGEPVDAAALRRETRRAIAELDRRDDAADR